MPGLPRQVTDYMDRLAVATRQVQQQLRSGTPGTLDAESELLSLVVRQVTTRRASTATVESLADSRQTGSGWDELTSFLTGVDETVASTLRDLLDSAEFPEVSRICAEHMGVRNGEVTSGDYLAELFLAAQDIGQRRGRGVYYTPWPIVRYLVRSVDELLRSELGVPRGLAALTGEDQDRPTLIDPACGTGLFLRAALQHADRQNAEVPKRGNSPGRASAEWLRGFDILPSAIEAARALFDVEFPHRESSAEVFHCRSALTPDTDALIDEARSESSPLVILGNPPYANFGGANRDPWILNLMGSYRGGLSERKHNLHDDAWKFLRWSQYQVERAGRGIVAFVINNAFLDGLTHGQLRASLLETFDQLYFCNLHGSRWKPGHARPNRSTMRDENVFGVRCGITLCLLVRQGGSRRAPVVSYADLRGTRKYKLDRLRDTSLDTTQWFRAEWKSAASATFILSPASNYLAEGRAIGVADGLTHRVAPEVRGKTRQFSATSSHSPFPEYAHGWGLDTIFAQYVSGVQTKRDVLFTDFDRQELAERMREHAIRESMARGTGEPCFEAEKLHPYMVAPWDVRWIYYEPRWLGRARYEVMRHLLEPNLAFVFMRQSTNPGEYDHFLVTPHLVSDRVFHSGHGAPYAAPLLLTRESTERSGNFRDEFLLSVEQELGLAYREVREQAGSAGSSFGPRELLAYLYGMAWTPSYRRQFADELPRGFPRIPRPTSLEGFRATAALGEQLLTLHGDARLLHDAGRKVVARRDVPPRLSTARAAEGIPGEVWEKRIGGVAVVRRWLKQRRHRGLSVAEQVHLHGLVEVLAETRKLEQGLEFLIRGPSIPRAETLRISGVP